MEDDGGHIIPNSLIGFDPASGEDRTVALQRWQKQIIGTFGTSPNPLFTAMTRMPATGKVHSWSPLAAAVAPTFPYGTIVRPTTGNRNYQHSTRMMVIGPLPSNPDTATLLIVMRPDNQGFAITNDSLAVEWEEVPD